MLRWRPHACSLQTHFSNIMILLYYHIITLLYYYISILLYYSIIILFFACSKTCRGAAGAFGAERLNWRWLVACAQIFFVKKKESQPEHARSPRQLASHSRTGSVLQEIAPNQVRAQEPDVYMAIKNKNKNKNKYKYKYIYIYI